MSEWYLLHTKAQLERRVYKRVKVSCADVLLPMLKKRVRRWGRLVNSVGPLFPGYVFVRPGNSQDWSAIEVLPGVRGLVRFCNKPSPVP